MQDVDGTEENGDESQYPGPSKLFFIVLGLNLALFLVGLDNTIISSAIPKIADHFHALNDLMWGKLFTFYSVKWVFLTGLFIFELGSLVCGVAPTSTALIVGRAVSGIGGGGVGIGCFLLIAYSSFYINLPLGAITATIIVFFMKSPETQTTSAVGFLDQLKQMDPLGSATLLPGVICLLLALQWGGTTYAWHSGRIIALLVLAGVLLVTFAILQGMGFGLQSAFAPCQTVLPLSDITLGTSVIMFCENLGGAIMESVATNMFTNQLVRNIAKEVPSIDPETVVNAGATELASQVPVSLYPAVLVAYNKAVTHTFYVGLAVACCGVLGAAALEWVSTKREKGGKAEETDESSS
ncbi:MFS general substrate transporter [Aspergillus heteromorphus CBS 117.55]|uniref:MFS general substrate transporter n=1 Tax=Aspergillus heteromorphus CBS 117.55 TaxID=1448321 RepID=A0A317WXU5_9EURO|nr:MFS general substrate transporter [Aspergillus heteromorphus CBS 117.55]PWY91193.1 MFS general substrate transporter [Aspergillus heteromorphus CBS 117.55]